MLLLKLSLSPKVELLGLTRCSPFQLVFEDTSGHTDKRESLRMPRFLLLLQSEQDSRAMSVECCQQILLDLRDPMTDRPMRNPNDYVSIDLEKSRVYCSHLQYDYAPTIEICHIRHYIRATCLPISLSVHTPIYCPSCELSFVVRVKRNYGISFKTKFSLVVRQRSKE